ncbi:MAG: hypothetical protein J1G02_05525 [Clostridiales bacterium]|nr:hypothetical protein [Clostridiales bacterium]
MTKKIQDEIISSQNILFPVNVAKWEIYKVKDLDKYYAKVYFRKTDNSVKEFSIDIDCYSESGEKIDVQSNISITDINEKADEFFKIIPLNGKVEQLNISIVKCTADAPKTQNKLVKGIGVYELITYIISAITVLFYVFVTPFWNGIVSILLLMVLSACAVGLLIYLLIKKKLNCIMQILLSVMAVLFILSLRTVI